MFKRSEVYLTRVGTRSGPALEGFLVIKNKKKKKKKERKRKKKFKMQNCVVLYPHRMFKSHKLLL
jgi:hypothetical protein